MYPGMLKWAILAMKWKQFADRKLLRMAACPIGGMVSTTTTQDRLLEAVETAKRLKVLINPGINPGVNEKKNHF